MNDTEELGMLRGLMTVIKSGLRVLSATEGYPEKRSEVIENLRNVVHLSELARGSQFDDVRKEMKGFRFEDH